MKLRKLALTLMSIAAFSFAGMQLYQSTASADSSELTGATAAAGSSCCNFGNECPAGSSCKTPADAGQSVSCSAGAPNYCVPNPIPPPVFPIIPILPPGPIVPQS